MIGLKVPEAHLEVDGADVDSLRPDLVEQLRGQVQPGRGGGDAARGAGVHGLVPVGIGERLVDVGRERHLAVGAGVGEQADAALPLVAVRLPDLDHGGAVGRLEHRARRKAPTGADEGKPPGRVAGFGLLEEEDLGGATRGLSQRQPGGKHPGLVEDEDVATPQVTRQVADGVMARRLRRLEVHQQAGGGPGLDGSLGNCTLWEHVVELRRQPLASGQEFVPPAAK